MTHHRCVLRLLFTCIPLTYTPLFFVLDTTWITGMAQSCGVAILVMQLRQTQITNATCASLLAGTSVQSLDFTSCGTAPACTGCIGSLSLPPPLSPPSLSLSPPPLARALSQSLTHSYVHTCTDTLTERESAREGSLDAELFSRGSHITHSVFLIIL